MFTRICGIFSVEVFNCCGICIFNVGLIPHYCQVIVLEIPKGIVYLGMIDIKHLALNRILSIILRKNYNNCYCSSI